MIVEQVVCDGCGAKKGEANHWFIVAGNERNSGLTLWPISEAAQLPSAKHFCGTQCTLKYIAGKLETM